MREMNYFEDLFFEKGVITVLGTDKDSDFVRCLFRYLSRYGSVEITESVETQKPADYLLAVPDKHTKGRFVMHSREEIQQLQKSDYVIGLLSVENLEKSIGEAVLGAEDFATYVGKQMCDRMCPHLLANVIELYEKYDWLYIDGVSDEGKRYHARELARRHCRGTGVRIINTDNRYVEVLINAKKKEWKKSC